MPDRAPPNFNRELPSSSLAPEPELSEKQLKVEAKTPRIPSPNSSAFREIVYDDVTDGGLTEEDASPPRSSSKRFLDTQYGIRRKGEQLMIGDSLLFIDPDANLTIKSTAFRCTDGLWELLRVRM